MEKVSYSDGKKEAIVTFDGDEITVELIKGFPPGTKAEDFADVLLGDIATKDKVSHKPHIHTSSGQVVYTK